MTDSLDPITLGIGDALLDLGARLRGATPAMVAHYVQNRLDGGLPPKPSPEDDTFTPSTEQIRAHYTFNQSDAWDPERGKAFDRWLTARDAEIRRMEADKHARWAEKNI